MYTLLYIVQSKSYEVFKYWINKYKFFANDKVPFSLFLIHYGSKPKLSISMLGQVFDSCRTTVLLRDTIRYESALYISPQFHGCPIKIRCQQCVSFLYVKPYILGSQTFSSNQGMWNTKRLNCTIASNILKHNDVIHVSFWILEINYDRHRQMRLIYVSSLIFTFN